MPSLVARSPMPVPADRLFAWHERSGALTRLLPPWQPVRVEQPGGIRDGERVVLRLGPGPLALRWVAAHHGFVAGREFRDRQESGPFARWEHTHRCLPQGDTAVLEDEVEYELPGGRWLAPLAGPVARGALERMFRFRHARTRQDLRQQQPFADAPRLRVAITGATGLLGRQLAAFLTTAGHEVLRVTRRPAPGSSDVGWDPSRGRLDAERLEGADAVVHLAGESLFALRWTQAKKRAIRESRVRGTELLARTLARLERGPRVLVSASAVGFYGDRGDESLDESSDPGEGFLADVCRAWERATRPAADAGLRVVRARLGVILTAAGGALGSMLPPFQAGLGGRLGDGRQLTSWISSDDAVAALHFLLQRDDLSGPVALTAPGAVSNAELTRTLGRVLGRPTLLPVPAPAVRAALGEMADELLLASTRVHPAVLEGAGFGFSHPDLEAALRLELGRLEDGTDLRHDALRRAAEPASGRAG